MVSIAVLDPAVIADNGFKVWSFSKFAGKVLFDRFPEQGMGMIKAITDEVDAAGIFDREHLVIVLHF